jgi:thiol-disulfide isomerase/thioredoxin
MSSSGRPSVFRAATFDEAMQQAQAADSWLIVDATAVWCGPCKTMDQRTWPDAAVAEWLESHGIAIQIDVDEHQALARKLEVRAMPTVIAFRAGQEQDRVVGFRNPQALLAWFKALERGETDLDQARGALAQPERDMEGRLDLADRLLQSGKLDEAAAHYLWLWDNIAKVEPGMSGVRVSFMASSIERLVAAHAPARARFAEVRDRAGAAADADPAAAWLRFDWVVLNEVLGDQAATLAWFDGVKDGGVAAPVIEKVAQRLIPLLTQHKRWADIGRVYADPVAELLREHELMNVPVPDWVDPEVMSQVSAMMAVRFRENAALLFLALRAAGRGDEARAIEREASRLDPSDEMRTALRTAVEN